MEDEKRHDQRLDVLWRGEVVTEDGDRYPCAVRDISEAGAHISCDAELAEGSQVMLVIDALGDFAGQITWQKTGEQGLWLLAGPDLALKKFAEAAGSEISKRPQAVGDPLVS